MDSFEWMVYHRMDYDQQIDNYHLNDEVLQEQHNSYSILISNYEVDFQYNLLLVLIIRERHLSEIFGP
jgi:hypothetical protein